MSTTPDIERLCNLIEELAPDAGFWQKGKPLDFTLEDVLTALDDRVPRFRIYPSGRMYVDHSTDHPRWILGRSVREQPPSVLAFLLPLLES